MTPESPFSLTDHFERLSKDGDALGVLDVTVDFEYFRSWLAEGLGYPLALADALYKVEI